MSEKEVEFSLTFLELFQLSAEKCMEELKRIFVLWGSNRANLPQMDSGTCGSRTGGTDVVAKAISSAEEYIRSGAEMC